MKIQTFEKVLAEHPFFRDLRPEHLDTLVGCAANVKFAPGKFVFREGQRIVSSVYATPEYVSTLEASTPIAHHVRVDFELRGCPISRSQLLEVLGAFLRGRRPNIPTYSLCFECKRQGTVCVMAAHGTPCLGPVTQAGCGALCPSYHRGCYGCFGPMESPNTASLGARWEAMGAARPDLVRAFRTYNAGAVPFRAASDAYEQQEP